MLFRLACLALFFSPLTWGQGDSLSLSPGPVGSGTISLNLLLKSASGQQPAGVQWTLVYSSKDFTSIQVAAGPAAIAAGKSVNCAGASLAYNCLLAGVNSDAISDGILAVISLSISPGHSSSSLVQLKNPIAASAVGNSIPISATSLTVILAPGSDATLFVPVSPCRIADTRNANGAFGGPAIAGGSSRDFAIPSSACDIPANAAAYSLNVAIVPGKTLGYLTVWPSGQSQPTVATLNSLDGRIKSNAAIVAAGSNGAISVFATDTTHVILDINGYFIPANGTTALAFYPLTPCRIADTRNPKGLLGGPSLAAKSTRTFPITEGACGVPASAKAYSLNFAVVPKGPLGYLTVWPAGQTQPLAASLNAVTGTVTANAVIVPSGIHGDIDVFTTDATDLVIDVNGYFAPPGQGGLSMYTLTPCRVLDTRDAGGSPFHGTMNIIVSGTCAVPPAARAYVFNATVVPPGAFGYLTLWPQGTPQPVVSTLNAVDGAITSNMAIVPTSNGSIEAFGPAATHLILDIFGYFAP